MSGAAPAAVQTVRDPCHCPGASLEFNEAQCTSESSHMLHSWDGKGELCFGGVWTRGGWGVPQNERKMINQGCSVEHLPLILPFPPFLLSLTLWHSCRGGRGGRKSHRVAFELCLFNSVIWIDLVTEGLKDNLRLEGSRCSHFQALWTSGTMWVLGEQLGSSLCSTLCQRHIHPCCDILALHLFHLPS